MPTIQDNATPAPYARTVDGKTETMIPIGLHESVNETSARALGLLTKREGRA